MPSYRLAQGLTMRRDALMVFVAIIMVVPCSARAGGDVPKKAAEFVKSALEHEIIGPKAMMNETIDWVDARVPRMPEVKSVADWESHANRMRRDALEQVIFRGEAARWRSAKTGVVWLETIEGGPGYRIKKLRFEALPGLWIPALLYEPQKLEGKVPAVLNVNGHDRNGKAADYKQIRCINQAKRGMLALNIEWLGMGQFADGNYRHDLINHIDLCGTGGIATHYLAMARGLDLLLSLEHTDPERIAVTGLSGGGWQTIFISSFDTRVKLTDPVAGYSSDLTRIRHFSDLGDSEQTPCDLATVADYAHMTAMMAPRPTLLTFNAKDDCCFAADHALPPLLDAARPIFKLYGKEANLRSHVNHDPGTHNYFLDNRQALYRMLGDHFYAGRKDYDPKEFPSESEVKSKDVLRVDLPPDNVSLHSLALALGKGLPRDPGLPGSRQAAAAWQDDRRTRLRGIVRPRRNEVERGEFAIEEKDGVRARYWKLKAGSWSVPVVELSRGAPQSTVVLIADAGRKSSVAVVNECLEQGNRVLAVDPFYLGESQIAERAYLFALLIETIGDRCLGIQASEIASVARWARAEGASEPVKLLAVGPRSSVIALVAAGLETSAIGSVELRGSHGSLKELIESKAGYADSPELFCFGLLRDFDILQLAALVAPRPLTIVKPSERAKKELAGLKAWYAACASDWDPLAVSPSRTDAR